MAQKRDLSDIEGLEPEVWKSASVEDRIVALQQAENSLAEAGGREPVPVMDHNGDPDLHGAYNHDQRAMFVHQDLINADDPREAVNTVAHEGRHAYQYDCVENADAHPEIGEDQREAWRGNLPGHGQYISGDDNWKKYHEQPVEEDARAFADQITNDLYDQHQATEDVGQDVGQSDAPAPEADQSLGRAAQAEDLKHDDLAAWAEQEMASSRLPPPPPQSSTDEPSQEQTSGMGR
jgi:cell division septum initiation protein DivIVA